MNVVAVDALVMVVEAVLFYVESYAIVLSTFSGLTLNVRCFILAEIRLKMEESVCVWMG